MPNTKKAEEMTRVTRGRYLFRDKEVDVIQRAKHSRNEG